MDALTCLLMDTAKTLKTSLTNELKPHNLTCRQAIALRSLENDNFSAKEIGQACSMDKATLSAVLEKLIEHNYISCQQNQNDKRENIYSVTQEGIDILPQISSVEKSCMNRLLGVLEEDEYTNLFKILIKLQDTLQQ